MKQFLTTATIYNFKVNAANLGHLSGSVQKRLQKIQKAFVGKETYFDVEEQVSGDYLFSLKKPVVEGELIPFLSEFYGNLHHQGFKAYDTTEGQEAALPPSLATIPEKAVYRQFRFDEHSSCSVEVDNHQIPVQFSSLMLVLENETEGSNLCTADSSMHRFEQTLAQACQKYESGSLMKCYVV